MAIEKHLKIYKGIHCEKMNTDQEKNKASHKNKMTIECYLRGFIFKRS